MHAQNACSLCQLITVVGTEGTEMVAEDCAHSKERVGSDVPSAEHASYEPNLTDALTALRVARSQLGVEIASYPTPISGCDAQFNRLLSDRTRIANAIRAIENQPFIATPRQLAPSASLESR